MKTWSLAEIESLMSTVEALGPSAGFKKHMENNPERTFQACSHMYYRQKLQHNTATVQQEVPESAGSPAKHTSVINTKKPVSCFTAFKNWLSKLFS
jgi:hypothetical protein